MKRLFCLLLLLSLAGCAGFDEFAPPGVFDTGAPCAAPPVRACGDGAIGQTSGSLPAQTVEPPR